jgi:hypothetical protein
MNPNGLTGIAPRDMTSKEYRTTQTDLIRSEGLTIFSEFNGRRCGVKDWDPMVYAGVMDRIDTTASRGMTSIGNSTRRNFCNAQKNGTKRWKNAATAWVWPEPSVRLSAPCSNPSCNNWETEPKEFQKYSRCKAVAHCSRDCQRKIGRRSTSPRGALQPKICK